MAKKNVTSIAKKGKAKSKTTNVKTTNKQQKKEPVNNFEKKAKEKIDNLIANIEFSPEEKKTAESKISKEEMGGIDWLSEQVDMLYRENEKLKKELTKREENPYVHKPIENEDIKIKETLLNEFLYLQKLWNDPNYNLVIEPKSFILRLVKLFPYLKDYINIR